MNLVPENLNELQNFERGEDPKRSLDIGLSRIIPTITSDDLELLPDVWDDEKKPTSYEEFYEEHSESYEDDEEAREYYDRLYNIGLAIRDKIKWGKFFDHHEFEDAETYLYKPPKGYKYAYNSYPEGDGVDIVWSKIKLPAAEEL